MQSESTKNHQFSEADDDLKCRIRQLLPPRPRKPGLRCGLDDLDSALPLRSIPKQFLPGAHRTLDPPLLHYGWHFKKQDLKRVTAQRGLFVEMPLDPEFLSDDRDCDSEEGEDIERGLDEDTRRARAKERAEARKVEKARRVEFSHKIGNDMDIHSTLRNVLGYLKERQLSVPCLRYRCVCVSTGVMISIVSNYHTNFAISERAVRTLQEIFEREDEPVWDMDYWSRGWSYRSLRYNK
ncbi:hypothetical protein K435DRAFT_521882 [Dendrothele bispora CBS 962.96]|uniref:Uncharacterized protein n=1 Tax=Dendrothele bispora (strain CBS 962.96) TaxID=1314807 RepID=A0A4S8M9H0_DENBC|nr:hypothetical protein K435DRAFT_521882 [Dendrothele bispora CBS 962.96]